MAASWIWPGFRTYLWRELPSALREACSPLQQLNDLADAAMLRGDQEVMLLRDEWMVFSREAGMLTREPIQSSHLRMWFRYSGIRFVYQIREPTPDDEYILCLEAAGWV